MPPARAMWFHVACAVQGLIFQDGRQAGAYAAAGHAGGLRQVDPTRNQILPRPQRAHEQCAIFLAVSLVLLSNPFAALANASTLSGGALDQQPPALVGAIIALAILGSGAYLLGFPIWLIGIGQRLQTLRSRR